jgi:hypothetical protein
MMKKVISFAAVLAIAFFSGTALAAPISQVTYASLTGTELITFEDLPQTAAPGVNYDNIFVSGGAAFAERFVGQTLTTVGGFDQLSGTPAGSLGLQAGAPDQNINIFAGDYNNKYGNVLTGLGPVGFPSFDAIGEGSFAVLFSTDQSQFGFSLVGGDGGQAFVSFFGRDGSLIDTVTVAGLTDAYYGFAREGGVKDIAGISVYTNDGGGIAFDDLKHDVASSVTVPEPTTLLFLGFSLIGLAGMKKRTVK